MKHIKQFEAFINERYFTDKDIKNWEKVNSKLPFPPEVLAASKKIARYGLAEDDELTRARLWLIFNDNQYQNLKKYGDHVYKFYGSDFYSAFSSGYEQIYMTSMYYAAEIISYIEDKIANKESVESAYYEVKEYFKSHGINYDRSRIFESTVNHVENWMKNKVR